MLIHKLRCTIVTLLALAAFATGEGFLTRALAMKDDPPKKPPTAQPPLAAQPDDTAKAPAPGRMFVVGRVLDPQGKPVPNASVMVYARSMVLRIAAAAERIERLYAKELGRALSDGAGRFQVDVPRTSSSRHDEFGAVALAPGYGAGWVELDPDAERPTAGITLRPEQVIHGRLFDLQGQPARDLRLSVTAIRRALPNAPSGFRENFEGPAFLWTHPDDLPGWPSPAISGADGRFTLHGVGSGLRVFLSVLDPRFTSQVIEINTEPASTAKPLTFALQPVRTITGRVTYADTGKPVPHSEVLVTGFDQMQIAVGPRLIIGVTDSEGRFRANPGPGAEGFVGVSPPEGQPYLAKFRAINWPKGAVTYSANLALPRGVMMRGKVTERGSGRPVTGAVVIFWPHRLANDDVFPRGSRPAETAADGSFALAVAARRGYVIVRGPSDDYVLHELDRGRLLNDQPDGRRVYAHAFIACEPKPGGESLDMPVALRPGVTVKGRVVGPDGQPVSDAWMLSRIHFGRRIPGFEMWRGDQHGIARNGQFELRGLDPDSEVPVSFLEPKRKLGATVRFSGNSAGDQPIVVKLEPCATATARLVGPDGKPVRGFTPPRLISMVVTAGESIGVRAKARKEGSVLADEDFQTNIDSINYPKDPASDAQGRIVFPALIPGSTYRIVDRTTIRTPTGPQLRKEFTVKFGEILDLGDILIEKSKTP